MARPRAFDEAVALQKALDTFWHRGYSATSMEDLVAGTGLNRASLYATFGDKHQLFMRALRQYQQQAYQNLTALTADPDVPALDHVRQILALTAGLCFADEQQKGCFMVNTITELVPYDAEAHAVASQYQQFFETLLTTILSRGQQRGEVRPTAPPQAQARLLLSVLNGLRVLSKANSDPQLLQDVLNTALLALA
ncbi:TetR/AcrR family transcriptional regulator [Hymenobacter psoromatis]|uniref:TetR/AcrR family transcriptional regulator n=1 Tax=Hymenobacter psoromatis TaxID=1484116 RepID=UPI001CC09252|nr:TetR/AcrR family transcriptional regulator [Hymenobacter psoromatis]